MVQVYGYIYNSSTGVITAYPNSVLELATNGNKAKYYMVSKKIDDNVTFLVEGTEGAVHKSESSGIYVVWYKSPNPIEAKAQFFNYLKKESEDEINSLKKKLEKTRDYYDDILSRFGI